ncbi:MAG TPA: amidohydrolase family protein [Streptosporangiaceae bacterium]|nr:amidohydrolase family protein [Streptosporangiaceae bacterium]
MSISAVTGGTVITPGGPARADVLIRDGTIAAIGEYRDPGGQQVDAAGCYVLPGGVDPHCHLMPGVHPATSAAARGGTTTVLTFTGPAAGERDLDALLRERGELERGGAVTDIGLHAAIYDPEHISHDDLAAMKRAGAAAIKIFLAYPELGIMCSTRRLYELMCAARELGLLVQVHCENAPLIDALVEEGLHAEALQAGPRSAGAPADVAGPTGVGAARAGAAGAVGGGADGEPVHPGARIFADTRPPEVEEEAVARTLAVASLAGASCYLVHLSSADSVEQVRLARRRGQRGVFAEVCTHHLVLDDTRYAGADAERYLVCPPLRDRRHVEALWEGLADGTIDTVGSDHCQVKSPVTGPLAEAGHRHTYGLAGVGSRLPLLLSAAAARGLPIERVAQLAAENPARAFGHYPAKGALTPGSDADLVIFDPSGEAVLPNDGFGDGTGDSIYAGMTVHGGIRAVLLRGQLIVSGGELVDGRRPGRYLPATAAAS